MKKPDVFATTSVLAGKFKGPAVFDSSPAGHSVGAERSDEPGNENCWEDVIDDDYHSQSGRPMTAKVTVEDNMRWDSGYRHGEDLPTAEQQLREPLDTGKVYTQDEIQALYPNGYVAGAPSLHSVQGSHYCFPEARPTRICG